MLMKMVDGKGIANANLGLPYVLYHMPERVSRIGSAGTVQPSAFRALRFITIMGNIPAG